MRDRWDLRHPDGFRALVAYGPEPEVVAEVIEARAVIEREAAARAADAASDGDFRLLAARIDDMDRAAAADATSPHVRRRRSARRRRRGLPPTPSASSPATPRSRG